MSIPMYIGHWRGTLCNILFNGNMILHTKKKKKKMTNCVLIHVSLPNLRVAYFKIWFYIHLKKIRVVKIHQITRFSEIHCWVIPC